MTDKAIDHNGWDFTLIYEDRDGDWILAEDLPWKCVLKFRLFPFSTFFFFFFPFSLMFYLFIYLQFLCRVCTAPQDSSSKEKQRMKFAYSIIIISES